MSEIYYLIFWGLLAIGTEVYLKLKVIDDDGVSSSSDDDSKAMSKQYAEYSNKQKASYRTFSRCCYIILPLFVYCFINIALIFG